MPDLYGFQIKEVGAMSSLDWSVQYDPIAPVSHSNYTHQTAPTQFVEAAGIRFAYRRFANRRFGVTIDIPLLFFMHFTGTMDHWDPALTDGFSRDREVILFNNAGISSSGGEVPTSIEEMARHAAAFTSALGIKKLA